MSLNKEVTVYTFDDKEYIQEQFEILIRNSEKAYVKPRTLYLEVHLGKT